MEAPDYERILKTAPEILRMSSQVKVREDVKQNILDVADGIICLSSLVMGGAAMVASILAGQDTM